MKIRDIIGIALISVLFFPFILMAVLIFSGVARIEFGIDPESKAKTNEYLRTYRPFQDKAEVEQMKTFEALELKKAELEKEKAAVGEEIKRLENLKLENQTLKETIVKNRKEIERLVAQSSELQNKRIKALAEVYGSMRPEEAAPILLTLDNKMVAAIIRQVPEVRSQSKLMGAIGNMNVKRAAKISEIMGKPFGKKIKK